MECIKVHLLLQFAKDVLGGAMSQANPSEASGKKGAFCPLRILFVQAKRVWNPQVFRQISARPIA